MANDAEEFSIERGFIKFKRKPAKSGDAYMFWIPASYIKNGLIDVGEEYDVFVRKRKRKVPPEKEGS